MTRVLHICEAIEGGVARHLVDLVRWTPDVTHYVAVPDVRSGGLTDTSAVPALRDAHARVQLTPMTRQPLSRVNGRAAASLTSLVRREQIDVVHGHSSIGGALARLVAGATRRPCIYTPHGLHPHPVFGLVERMLARVTMRIVAVSPSEARLLAERHVATAPRVVVIVNAVDPGAALAGPDLRSLAGLPAGGQLIVSVGRLVPQKDPLAVVEVLSRVLAATPEAVGILIGDGTLAPAVVNAVTNAHSDRLRLLPQVPGVAACLNQADVVLLMSRYEGAPYVPLEAARAGTPAVATDIVGSRDIVRDGVTGLLVPVGDTARAADAVLRLIADPVLRARMAEAGRELIRSTYDAEGMARSYWTLYEQVRVARTGDWT